ncbi:MAG: hypothetical protein K0R84_2455 [Clostridia bacterium]|jgi:hypothetical protein|nr:hypothetical protein [Clostridia bacterium]
MIKALFFMIIIFTFLLNIILTIYLIRGNFSRDEGYIRHEKIVSFDLSANTADDTYAAATTALDTEILITDAAEER